MTENQENIREMNTSPRTHYPYLNSENQTCLLSVKDKTLYLNIPEIHVYEREISKLSGKARFKDTEAGIEIYDEQQLIYSFNRNTPSPFYNIVKFLVFCTLIIWSF